MTAELEDSGGKKNVENVKDFQDDQGTSHQKDAEFPQHGGHVALLFLRTTDTGKSPSLLKSVMFWRTSEIGICLQTRKRGREKSRDIIKLSRHISVALNGWFLVNENTNQNSELGHVISQ